MLWLVSFMLLFSTEASFTKFDPALTNTWFDADWSSASFIVKDITTYPTTYSGNDLTAGLKWLDESTQVAGQSSVKLYAERGSTDSSHRSEFRFHPEFRATPATAGDTIYNRLSFQAYLSNTQRSEYTFAQIHIKSTESSTRPPIRISYNLSQKDSEGTAYTNYFFLNYNRPSLTYEASDVTTKYALMAHTAATLYNFHMILTNGILTVTINDIEVFSMNLDSSWATVGETLYFKTGVYCSGSGTVDGNASVEYLQLERVIGSSTVVPPSDWNSTEVPTDPEEPIDDGVDDGDDSDKENSASVLQLGVLTIIMFSTLFFF